ncbi:MAG: thioesterase family protein [Halioglobus sp.]|nr:thioesterase family protein [Halioglobus sp.]
MNDPELAWHHPRPHLLSTRVQAADIDGLNHTNNAVYVKWCEQVAWSHSVSLGLDLDCYRRLDRAMVITHSEYHYLRASREGDDIVVGTWIVDWDGRLTMRREFQVIRAGDAATLLRGAMRFACVELGSGRPRRMPAEFVQGYGPAVLSLD